MNRRHRFTLAGFSLVILGLVGFAWYEIDLHCSPPYSIDKDPAIARRVWAPLDSDFPEPPKDAPQLDGWPVTGDPVPLSRDMARELREILNSHSTYVTPDLSDCFEPGMAVSFGDGPERVDVVICLTCEQVEFFCNGARGWRRLSPAGAQRLKAIYQRMFPPRPPA